MDALKKPTEYEQRMTEFLRESHGLKNPQTTEGAIKARQKKAIKQDL